MVSAAQNSAVDAFTSSGASTVAVRNYGSGHGVWSYVKGTVAAVRGESAGTGVEAIGDTQGVYAHSGYGDGIRAESSAENKSGVYAYNDVASTGYGVYARGTFQGVHGESPRFGVTGVGTGTSWEAIGCAGFGDKTGVLGAARNSSAMGVQAINGYDGTALRVDGRASFKRSGLATTIVGAAHRTVTVTGTLTSSSKFLVTPQGNPGAGVYVTYAKYVNTTQFNVYFSKACTAAVKIAWMVLD